MNFYIYLSDQRQKAIGYYLEKKGHKFIKEEISSANIIILPFNTNGINFTIDEELLREFGEKTKFFTGVENLQLKKQLDKFGFHLINYMDYKEIAILNSVPTAEGLIYNLIGKMGDCINNSNFLIIGYGICGKEIGDRILGLNGKVSIMEISDEEISKGKIKGINNIRVEDINKSFFHGIINTVPIKILDENALTKLNKNTLIFDIASYPYGFNIEEMEKYNIFYKRLPSLPTFFCVEYSGRILGEFIIKNL